MKKTIILVILGVFLLGIVTGCTHTLDKLSRFQTGRVGLGDFWQSVLADEKELREVLW